MRSILLLFVFCLVAPAAALADDPVGELAPGFYVCTKQARTSAATGEEYKKALLVCLDKAEKYWKPLTVKKWMTEHIMMEYYGMDNSKKGDLILYQAWLRYKEAGSDLLRAEGNELRARIFEVKETKRYARTHGEAVVSSYNGEDKLEERLSPGFRLCFDGSIESQTACLKIASKYWNNIYINNYEIYKALYQNNPKMIRKIERFHNMWKQYLEAEKEAAKEAEKDIYKQDTERVDARIAVTEAWEVRRQALLLEVARSLW